MSRQNIRFNGMNRNSNVSDSRPGDCEELINVRSENGALKIVKDKHEVSVNIPYKDVIIHDISGVRNYIGKDSSGWVWFSPETGLVLMRLYEGTDNVFVATMNNMLVISDRNNVCNTVYLYTNDTYREFAAPDSMQLPLDITHYVNTKVETTTGSMYTSEFVVDLTSKEAAGKSFAAARNRFLSENPTYVEGYYMVGINYTLWDGSETKLEYLKPFYPVFMDTSVMLVLPTFNASTRKVQVNMSGLVKSHTFSINALADLEPYKELVKSVNVYVSQPVASMDFSEDENWYPIGWVFGENGKMETSVVYYNAVSLEKSDLHKQLLYKYKSYTLEEIQQTRLDGSQGVGETIRFGVDSLPTGKTLDVDNGNVIRAGNVFAYNNRIHFFDSVAKLDLSDAYHILPVEKDSSMTEVSVDMLIYLRGPVDDIVLRFNDITMEATSAVEPYTLRPDLMCIVQDSRAYKLVFVRPGYYAELGLLASPSYNYSYAYTEDLQMKSGTMYDDLSIDTSGIYTESNAVNVTAQNNPLVFPVEHSYLFDGTIKALAYATEPISQTQIGQYPLYVFTDKGIYAMEQGSGTVLYANQVMINTDKCDDDVIQTRNGVVYIANGSIYILSGRNSLNISLPVSGPIDKDIRKAVAYTQCCLNDKLYNVADNISQVEFQDYIPDARLVYIPYRDELVVSNPQYKYSYVFSFIYKTWHKISESLSPVGDNIVQRAIFTSSAVAKAATGEIIVANAVITPEHSFTAMQRAIYSGSDFQSGMNERYALVIDDVQVSSVYVRYPARLALIIAMLCKDVPYLDCMYDGASQYIFSSIAFDEGGQVELIQSDTGYTVFSITFEEYQNVISIPDKAVGGTISVNSSKGGSATTRKIIDGDSVVSLAAELNSSINGQAALGIHSDIGLNTLSLTASAAGAAGNGITLTLDAGNYVSLYHTGMSGGKDVTLEPGDYSILVDYAREKESTKVVHLQSRPMSFSQAYSIMRRMILHCKASITSPDNLSLYLFASNNLSEWQCVAASQKSDVTLDHIRLQRAARAYRYYIVIIGGQVYTTTELSYIIMEIEERFESKIR